MEWRYAFASVQGTSHVETGTPCQDSSRCELLQAASGETYLLIVAADGAGSASHAERGAEIACEVFITLVSDYLNEGNSVNGIDRSAAVGLLNAIRESLRAEAELCGVELRELASTLAAAVVGAECGVFMQIGDGVIVVSDIEQPEAHHLIFWPQRGKYANMTHFITEDEYEQHLQFDSTSCPIVDVAVMTDGIQSLALRYDTQQVHQPFFTGLFRDIRKIQPIDAASVSERLDQFLRSPRVNERTDDDKTLLLATRYSSNDTTQ